MTSETERYCSVNGSLCPETEATLSPFDRGFIYGDAIYEVVPAFWGRPFAQAEHLTRLERSAATAYIPLPPWLPDALTSTLEANADWMRTTPVSRVGVWVSRGVQSTAWRARRDATPTVVVFCWPVDDDALRRAQREGIRAVVAWRPRIPARVLDPRLKMTSRLPMVLAELETADQGETPLLLDDDGCITEGSSSNVFAVVDDVLVTPRAEAALEGVTRGLVVSHARAAGVTVEERPLGTHDCANASEAFMTSSSMGIVPVREVVPCSGSLAVPGPVTRDLMEWLGEATGYRPWADPADEPDRAGEAAPSTP